MKLRHDVQAPPDGDGRSQGKSIRAHIRLYLYIYGFVTLLAIALILLLTNNLVPNTRNVINSMQSDSKKTAANIRTHFGGIAAKSIDLSKTLSADIETALQHKQVAFSDKKALAEHIPDLLDKEIDLLLLALERADCSGVFVVLDATVNPNIPESENSRAGIYIRRVEPNRIGNPSEMLLLRGNTESGIRRGMTLQASWDLEFDIAGRDFWHLPFLTHAKTSERKLPNLYVWTFETILPRNGEASLLCTIPLIDSNGGLLGVCGFEITEACFQNYHAIASERYPDLTLCFSELENGALRLEDALFSDNKKNVPAFRAEGMAQFLAPADDVEHVLAGNESYRIVYEQVPLYINSSHFASQRFAVSILLAEAVYRQEITADVMRGIGIFSGMLLLGWMLSLILGKRLEKPFTSTIEAVKSHDVTPSGAVRVGVKELDEILRIIAKPTSGHIAQVGELFVGFLKKIERLTPKEREIVAMYAMGKLQEEMLAELFIAPSTLKTHNLHIYAKLDVKSIDELRLYLDLISRSDSHEQLKKLLELP
ncbi:LuxR C-terminal-related transcriptional regulator [Christensenellaceae bacterium OttesenSCG-928-M15]|nr:LuxR C-terminal-related transcriptional regulator [Christensenellaceae bacterium OttesenSCG-928-M15]